MNKDEKTEEEREINDFKLSYCFNQTAVDRLDAILAHLSAQYEKLIGECLPEEISGDIPTSLDIPDDILHKMQNDMKHFREGFNTALSQIRTSLQERGIKIK